MIVSASRRTDIPAHFSSWLMNRLAAGFCLVANPYNARQLYRVSLAPCDVTALVFWTKNPHPMLPHLDLLEDLEFRHYWLVTVNAYDANFEPNLPSLQSRMEAVRQLSERLGPRRVIWRYDPIILSNVTPAKFHEEAFAELACQLSGHVERCVVSLVDFYRRTERRLGDLRSKGIIVEEDSSAGTAATLLRTIGSIARHYRITVQTCAENDDLRSSGIQPGSCIDANLIRELWGVAYPARKDPGQRALCGCSVSKDIGVADTCLHGCAYCYATRHPEIARQRYRTHDPTSPLLWGHVGRETPVGQIRLL